MSMVEVSNLVINGLQIYFLAILMRRLQKLKYHPALSLFLMMVGFEIVYLIMKMASSNTASTVFIGITGFSIVGVLLFEGSVRRKVLMSTIAYLSCIILDGITYVTMSPWIQLEEGVGYGNIQVTANLMLFRNAYNIVFYMFYVLIEIIKGRKREWSRTGISVLAVILSFCQVWNIVMLYQCNMDEFYIFVESVFCTSIIILGYHITIGLFYKTVEVQEKEKELEQKAMERQYQYDYYLLARKQSEEIRDIRHDMRNQLQTMQYLLHSEKEEERNRAAKMLSDLQNRLQKREEKRNIGEIE